ncbi:TetR family transcriptional regulator [Shewanella sp. NFH-SH190041]|uniref:TetR/AcrR family transcriptional regulator n=1 Tax=Shewanella sp. NFH-SH190041 TaxID=2950245 RepID=UPI0021C3ABE6|nr:TetR/AcrR family transcriptional regulator [Shewanella sp. NFH-SH190041]BDM65302.1 TetR family transcriptional regulator [Shewanella sp. NFH-SH190041]
MKLSDRKKLDILDAAETEFLQQGFERANTDAITQLARVSKRTLYRHFNSKETLFTAVLHRLHDRMRDPKGPVFNADMSLYSQLLILLQHESQCLYRTYSIPMLRMIMVELLRQPELAREIIEDIYDRDTLFSDWLASAADAGMLQITDLEVMSQLLQGMFNGLLLWPALMTDGELPSRSALKVSLAEIARVFVAAYGKE